VNIRRVGWILKIVAIGAAGVALIGWVVMTLWNWLAPEIFGWHPIGFVQAVALLVLCRILFGGFQGGHRGRGHWRARMAERLEKMTPEERERFQAGMRARCGRGSGSDARPGESVAAQGS